MKPGMLHLFENPVGKSEHQIIKEQMELMYEAERLGFNAVWAAEHYLNVLRSIELMSGRVMPHVRAEMATAA